MQVSALASEKQLQSPAAPQPEATQASASILQPQAGQEAIPPANAPVASAKINSDLPANTQPEAAPQASLPEAQPGAQLNLAPAEASLPMAASPASQPEAGAPQPPTGVRLGYTAPDFTLNTLDGQQVRLSDFRGKNVLINYWVTWCIPCKEEVDYIQRIFQDYQAQNIVILSINGIAQDSLNEVQQFIAQHTLTYPVLLDENDTFWDSFMVKFFPTSFFIDEQGVIRFIQLGGKPEQDFRTMVDQLLTDQL